MLSTDKKYFFLNGMPRAGNTLLSSILNQNPDIKASANSFTVSLMLRIYNLKSSSEQYDADTELFLNFPDHNSLDNIIKNVIPNYYKDWDCKYIIDRSAVGTKGNLELMKKYFKQPLKIIVLMRKIEDVLSSFLKVLKNKKGTDEEKVNFLMRENGSIHEAVVGAQHLRMLSKYENIAHFIDYVDLINDPEQTIKGIYNFLDIPEYTHRFSNQEQFNINGITYKENIDLHKIKTDKIDMTHHKSLPNNILKKLQGVNA